MHLMSDTFMALNWFSFDLDNNFGLVILRYSKFILLLDIMLEQLIYI